MVSPICDPGHSENNKALMTQPAQPIGQRSLTFEAPATKLHMDRLKKVCTQGSRKFGNKVCICSKTGARQKAPIHAAKEKLLDFLN